MLTTPSYTQPETVRVTGLPPEMLQSWVNRRTIELSSEQNPGSGRRRLYSAVDVAKLAIMRRLFDLNVALRVGREIAEAAADKLARDGEIGWNAYLVLNKPTLDAIDAIRSPNGLAKFNLTIGDPYDQRVSDLVEPKLHSRRERASDDKPINPARREELARRGIHAEPAIIFPLGEIVNGALAQLRAIDEGEAK